MTANTDRGAPFQVDSEMIKTLSDALAERGYDKLTPVQEAVTDPALRDADLLVSAQTGSGKTVGFGLAIAETLMGDAETLAFAELPLALVIAPTRELAFQVKRELDWLYAKAGARVASCVGGMDFRDERRALDRGAHIVVGTPGRLRDHIQRGTLDMSGLRAIVLDEADEMLDLGFRDDLEFMLGEAPEDRRTLMFSATVPPTIAKLAKTYQRNAERVTTITGGEQHADIGYRALQVAERDTENAIINLLRYHEAQNALVFANTRATVARLTARFANRGFSVVSLSGELSQSERTHALQAMRDGRAKVCVATDVAARGIDLPNLELVIHAELPSNAEGLLHRSGRTGRAGRKGISALIVPNKLRGKATRLLNFAKVTAEWDTPPSAEDILRKDEERLLSDPSWEQEATASEQEFATKLLSMHSPETIAAAYLRLYQAKQSAPEQLSDPGKREEKPRREFGASTWFSVSAGRDQSAEARWLLPMVCKAAGLDKTAIGAIRIQQTESFIEISEAAATAMVGRLGAEGSFEDGVQFKKLDAAPNIAKAPRRDAGGPRPDRGPRPPREDRPKRGNDRYSKPEPAIVPPAPVMPESVSERPVRSDDPQGVSSYKAKEGGKPRHKGKPDTRGAKPARSFDDKPRGDRKPYGKSDDKPSGDRKPYAKAGDKPKGKYDDKPRGDRKPYGKSEDRGFGKSKPRDGKPAGKGYAGHTGSAESKPSVRERASDTSKRFTPPGSKGGPSKPRGKPGGGAPRRKG